MVLPPDDALLILRVIVQHMGRFVAERPASYLGYKEVCDVLKLKPPYGKKYGEFLSENGLAALAEWAKAQGHPALTGLIVDQTDFRPREGYYRVCERPVADEAWWHRQIAESLQYNWKRFLYSSEPLPPEPPPIGSSVAPPPKGVEVTIYRVVRDTELAMQVKRLHQHKCQLCEMQLKLKDGTFYSEAHHVHPLGFDPPGPDDFSNIMCVCPNCHALLDHGAIPLDLKTMRRSGHHEVGQSFIDFHNENIYGVKPG